MAYRAHDVAAELTARMDGHRESEGTEFTADYEQVGPQYGRQTFIVETTRPDGSTASFRVEVSEIGS